MKAIKFYSLFKIALIILTYCHFVAAVLQESEENIGTNEINTKFVNSLQVRETNKRADFEDSDHKLKMSVVNSENPESRVNNFVYLLKHEELKGFLKTLPIEILRKLRTLASKDIDSAQKFVIRLAQERKKKWGDQGIAERLGMISEARAKPLISNTATTNPSDKDSADSSTSTRRINSMSKFLRNYKFTPSVDNGNEESHNPWKPIAPSTTSDNSTTVTYIVHEVLHPKHPYLNQSTLSRVTSTTSTTTTTEEYPSVLPPMTDPPPTPPMPVKTPNPNYRPTILHHEKSNDLQNSVDNVQKLRDNYYSGSRQHRGSRFKQLKDSLPQSQNSFNQNPSTLLPHAQGGVTRYTWGIAPGVVDTHSYYINPTHLAAADQNPGLGDTSNDVQNMNSYNYPDYPTLSYPYQGVWMPNTIPGYNIKNSFTQDSTRNSLPTHTMAHNNAPYSYQQVTYPVVQTNEANYHRNPSPANYYMLHPPPNNHYYNNELQDPSNVGHGHSHSHRGDKDYKYSSSDLHDYHGSGWTQTDSHDSHEYKGVMHRVKAYFYKGDRSAAEKVFEVSLGILAFLAFGGYLLMLIYQVFAATSAVPLFPLVTQAVPSNTGLFGILFGRNLDPKSSFNKYLNTQLDSLEKQVTIAFNNVISKFYIKEEDDNNNVHKQQNEL